MSPVRRQRTFVDALQERGLVRKNYGFAQFRDKLLAF
jgi:hypothetical protein